MYKILVPTDFSACANNAIDFAHQLAALTQSRLILFHTIHTAEPIEHDSWHPQIQSPIDELLSQDKLAALSKKLHEKNPDVKITYETTVTSKDIPFEIVHIANQRKADLIVMGTASTPYREIPFEDFIAGEVLDISKSPVLIVPENASFSPINRIEFAGDLTREPSPDLAFVVEMARRFGADILFVHVSQPAAAPSTLSQLKYHSLYSHLNYDKVSFRTQQDTDIERVILSVASDTKADLLVMENHTKSFWEIAYHKSRTIKLALHTPIPLLVIHS